VDCQESHWQVVLKWFVFLSSKATKPSDYRSRRDHSADDAIEKLEAGASLIQLYTGFIYEGPALVAINQKILSRM
jgi:hypothetical protein